MSVQNPKENFDQLIRDGYCLIGDVLDDDILQRLRQVTDQLLDAQGQEIRAQQRSTGSMIDVGVHSIFAELVAYPPARAALKTLGFLRPPVDVWLRHQQTAQQPGAVLASGLVGLGRSFELYASAPTAFSDVLPRRYYAP